MVHVDYDSTWVIVSIWFGSNLLCRSFNGRAGFQDFIKSLKNILVTSGLIFGLGDMGNAFCGMLVSHLPEGYHFDISLTVFLFGRVQLLRYLLFGWLTQTNLAFATSDFGAVFLGLGILECITRGMLIQLNTIN